MVRRIGQYWPARPSVPIGFSLAQSHCAPGANGPGLRALAFRLWRMALALRPLPSPPLPSSSFSPRRTWIPRCPGAQAQATPSRLRAAGRYRCAWSLVIQASPRLSRPTWLHAIRPPSGSAFNYCWPRPLRLRKSRGAPGPIPRPAPRPPGGLYGGALKAHPSSRPRPSRGPSPARVRLAL